MNSEMRSLSYKIVDIHSEKDSVNVMQELKNFLGVHIPRKENANSEIFDSLRSKWCFSYTFSWSLFKFYFKVQLVKCMCYFSYELKCNLKSDHESKPSEFGLAKVCSIQQFRLLSLQLKWHLKNDHECESSNFGVGKKSKRVKLRKLATFPFI